MTFETTNSGPREKSTTRDLRALYSSHQTKQPSTAKYLWSAFGLLIALFVSFGVLNLKHLRSLETYVGDQADTIQRRTAATTDLELGLVDYLASVRSVLNRKDLKKPLDQVEAAINRSRARYSALAETARHKALVAEFADNWSDLLAESRRLIEATQAGTPVDRTHFRRLHNQLRTFLSEKMRLESAHTFEEHRTAAISQIRTMFALSTARTVAVLGMALLLGLTVIPRVLRMESRLFGSEQRFRTLVEVVPHGLLVIDRAGRIVLANAQIGTLFGYTREELLGQSVEILVPESLRPGHSALREKYFAAPELLTLGRSRDVVGVNRDGTEIPLEIALAPITADRDPAVLVAVVDLRERKKSEFALRESQERFSLAQQAGAVGTWDWNLRTNQGIWTDQVWRLFGREPGEFAVSIKNWLQCIHPDDREAVALRARQAMLVGKYFDEFRVVYPNGSLHFVECRGEAIFDENSRAIRMIGTVHDVTDRRSAARRVSEIQAKFRAVVENTADAVWSLDGEIRLLTANTAFHNLYRAAFGTTPTIGQSLVVEETSKDSEEASTRFRALYRRAMAGEHCHDEFCVTTEDGVRHIHVSCSPIWDEDKVRGVVGDSCDITRYKVTAEALAKAHSELEQRVTERTADLQEANERLSVMAGGLSHELNQPLTAIANYASGCLRRLRPTMEDCEILRGALTKIVDEVHRTGALIQHLRDLTARKSLDMQTGSVNDTVRETISIFESLNGGLDATVSCHLDEQLPEVMLDRPLITQVLLNLIRNGTEAMKQTERDQRELRIETSTQKDHVCVSVHDRGIGLTEQSLKNLFTPFRSSKSGGMGLGLVISKNIVELHGGRLWAVPQEGGGASFHFTLPFASNRLSA